MTSSSCPTATSCSHRCSPRAAALPRRSAAVSAPERRRHLPGRHVGLRAPRRRPGGRPDRRPRPRLGLDRRHRLSRDHRSDLLPGPGGHGRRLPELDPPQRHRPRAERAWHRRRPAHRVGSSQRRRLRDQFRRRDSRLEARRDDHAPVADDRRRSAGRPASSARRPRPAQRSHHDVRQSHELHDRVPSRSRRSLARRGSSSTPSTRPPTPRRWCVRSATRSGSSPARPAAPASSPMVASSSAGVRCPAPSSRSTTPTGQVVFEVHMPGLNSSYRTVKEPLGSFDINELRPTSGG